jgi:hypothetical protein
MFKVYFPKIYPDHNRVFRMGFDKKGYSAGCNFLFGTSQNLTNSKDELYWFREDRGCNSSILQNEFFGKDADPLVTDYVHFWKIRFDFVYSSQIISKLMWKGIPGFAVFLHG